MPTRGSDAVFVALVDAKIRAQKHFEYLQEKAAHPDPKESAGLLSQVNGDLTAAAERLDEIPLEAFADEEEYWQAKGLINQAGQIVVRNSHLDARPGDRPGEEPQR